jgi:hypothetical protein
MEDEVLQTVILEVLNELKEVRRQQAETMKMLVDIKEKTASSPPPLTALKTETSPVQTEKIIAVMNTRLDAIKQLIEAQPKPVIKQFRVLFFPEYNAREYFKTLGKIGLCILALIVSSYLFILGQEFILTNSKARQDELVNYNYRAVWNSLYRTSKKGVKQKMDSVWSRSLSK